MVPHRPQDRRETAVDILYENERGGFLCGVALFSSRALGGLDPSAWTNAYHRSSPTSIHTAQVPDPSWEWVWPEWRVNGQEGVGEDGWEYSFAFASAFSWHGPKWWNSFVRRRAWIRKRAKKRPGDDSLNADYFSIRPASYRSGGSLPSCRMPSKSSLVRVSACKVDEEPPEIGDMATLLATMRAARIDREKTEAIDSYLAHALDLPLLQGEMHDIMSLFVFQASRRQLLSHLMRKRDKTLRELRELRDEGGGDTPRMRERGKALDAAVRHADEEVGRLAYWSDVKMTEGGELRDGWYRDADQGLDQSGPAEPNKGKLPGP